MFWGCDDMAIVVEPQLESDGIFMQIEKRVCSQCTQGSFRSSPHSVHPCHKRGEGECMPLHKLWECITMWSFGRWKGKEMSLSYVSWCTSRWRHGMSHSVIDFSSELPHTYNTPHRQNKCLEDHLQRIVFLLFPFRSHNPLHNWALENSRAMSLSVLVNLKYTAYTFLPFVQNFQNTQGSFHGLRSAQNVHPIMQLFKLKTLGWEWKQCLEWFHF